ncbi:T9SS type A sorting domain-containing protein [candidate division WOR-3 bacterium]|nr:T9SS type A sorting domain-containing protein [candidate division WOR-3 bacterium]
MKKRNKQAFIPVMIILLWSINVLAQAPDTLWTRTYGGAEGDVGYSVQQTTDGGYIIAGYTYSFGAGESDCYLIKTNADGDTVWTKTYGGIHWDYAYSVRQTSDGGYIIAGFSTSFGAGFRDAYLIKADENGDTIWTRTYGGTEYDEVNEVQQTSDGGYIIVGITLSFGAGGGDVYLIKTDSNGDTIWTKTYGGAEGDAGNSVQQTSDGGYIIAGITLSFGAGNGDVYLIKTDEIGDTIWTKTYGGIHLDIAYSVRQTSDGGYIILGITHPTGLEMGDVYLIKTDANGDSVWAKIYEHDGYDYAYSVQQTSDNGYIFVCNLNYVDINLTRTDENGDTLWTKIYGGADSDFAYSVQQTTDGGYIVAGYTSSFGVGKLDVYLIKVLPEGATPQVWINPSSFSVALHPEESKIEPLVIGNSGNVILTWSISESPSVDWLMEDTTSGLVYPEDSMSVTLTFDATGLSEGAYFDTLVISTNDTNNPTINIPIELRVIMSDMIFVFPNPFMPKKGHTILTFANLPDEGTIKIYTIAGNLVWSHQFAHPEILYSWDVRNNDDKDIASGIYIYLVEDKSGDAVKKGKFAVVR